MTSLPKSIAEAQKLLASGTVTSAELIRYTVEAFTADKHNSVPLNAFLEIYDTLYCHTPHP